ncbi:MAG: hypothetical protein IJF02_05325 [Oscillospiraceae bacterium]|nr:hypothetical protein [Oscillospiraceae bacterium]
MGTYPILRGGEPIGQACVVKKGLYYHFSCRCDLSGEVIYRLTVSCGEKCESLGVPVPEGEGFVLNSRIPVNKLGQGEMTVRAVPKHSKLEEKFIPISPDEPFEYLRQLEKAVFEKRNGQPGILIRD